MDICGHSMKQCREAGNFTFPPPPVKIEHGKEEEPHFTEEDNRINLIRCKKQQFYDGKICRHLCSKTLILKSTKKNSKSHCESICFEIARTSDGAGAICPYQKYCINGCPCLHYKCEKTQSVQRMIPVFDLSSSETLDVDFAEGNLNQFLYLKILLLEF